MSPSPSSLGAWGVVDVMRKPCVCRVTTCDYRCEYCKDARVKWCPITRGEYAQSLGYVPRRLKR